MRIEIQITGLQSQNIDETIFTAIEENTFELQTVLAVPGMEAWTVLAKALLTQIDKQKHPDGTISLSLTAAG